MALKNPIEKLFEDCAKAVRTRYKTSGTFTWRDMFAKIANISSSQVDSQCDGPIPIEDYIEQMTVKQKLQFTLGQLPKAIRRRDCGSYDTMYGTIELEDIPYYIINKWEAPPMIEVKIDDSSFTAPANNTWSWVHGRYGLVVSGSNIKNSSTGKYVYYKDTTTKVSKTDIMKDKSEQLYSYTGYTPPSPPPVTYVTFTYDSPIQYQVEKGTTWGEWMGSPYGSLYHHSTGMVAPVEAAANAGMFILHSNGKPVYWNEAITSDDYYTGTPRD